MKIESHDILAELSSIRSTGYGVLDGGFATHLEDHLHQDISESPLWSASLLQTEKGCSSIVETHLDFLESGSQIISTSTYQASPLSFAKAVIDESTSKKLLIRSVELAEKARQQYIERNVNKGVEKTLISLSLGPFGAAQSDGSEYTGIYFKPYVKAEKRIDEYATVEDMMNFHLDRLKVLAGDSTSWNTIDLLAFETIPRIDEAIAIKQALAKLYSKHDCERKPAYISYVFPNGQTLPFPPQDIEDDKREQIQQHIDEIVKTTLEDDSIDGIGINCTKPYYLSTLVQSFTKSARKSQRTAGKKPYLFLYPDGGLIWDGEAREWKSDRNMNDTSGNGKKNGIWAEKVLEAAKECYQGQKYTESPWSGCFVGGCCKSTTSDIVSLRTKVEDQLKEGK